MRLQVMRGADGRSKGYGFVDFENQEDLETALKNPEFTLIGRTCTIKANYVLHKRTFDQAQTSANTQQESVPAKKRDEKSAVK